MKYLAHAPISGSGTYIKILRAAFLGMSLVYFRLNLFGFCVDLLTVLEGMSA